MGHCTRTSCRVRKLSESALAQENALWLLKKRAVNKEWDVIMGPYWDSLPQQGTLHTKETFPRNSLHLLQDDSMVLARYPHLLQISLRHEACNSLCRTPCCGGWTTECEIPGDGDVRQSRQE